MKFYSDSLCLSDSVSLCISMNSFFIFSKTVLLVSRDRKNRTVFNVKGNVKFDLWKEVFGYVQYTYDVYISS